jgi:hypothetical protein
MRPELERLAYIEAYLLRPQPLPADAAAWATQRLLDPELAADAEAQQQLYAGLQLAGRQQLRRELSAIHHRLYDAPGWWQQLTRRVRTSLVRWPRLRPRG